MRHDDDHKDFYKHVHEKMRKYKCNFVNEDNILNYPFDTQELMHAINTSNRNSAMCIDKIDMKSIYLVKFQIAPHLNKLWIYIYVIHGRSPFSWKFSNMFSIPRHGRDNSIAKNNQSLLSMMARLFRKALSNRIIT